MAMNGLGLIGWIGGWIVLLGISTRTPNWVVWVFMPYFFYGAYRAFIQVRYFPLAFHMLRVLRAYPWQLLLAVYRAAWMSTRMRRTREFGSNSPALGTGRRKFL
ncbi:hypothetical protein ACRJ4W_04350 [Streptomyces sp. GLT-R25]